jgi:NAD kinase
MEKQSDFKLIDGVFSVEDAEKVLTALFNYKIDFHNREDFSNHIRFNNNIENSKKRVNELIITRDDIKKLLSDSSIKNSKLVIKSTVSIKIEE